MTHLTKNAVLARCAILAMALSVASSATYASKSGVSGVRLSGGSSDRAAYWSHEELGAHTAEPTNPDNSSRPVLRVVRRYYPIDGAGLGYIGGPGYDFISPRFSQCYTDEGQGRYNPCDSN
jgi:hypothetical protein